MVNNCKVLTDPSGNIKLDKSDKNAKIDGVISGIMAMTGIIENNKEVEIPSDWTPTFF
jgi:phage terminase large subunit-like protein